MRARYLALEAHAMSISALMTEGIKRRVKYRFHSTEPIPLKVARLIPILMGKKSSMQVASSE